MARIKFSSIGITNIVGKAGGSVYSTNKGGAYFKNFVKPSNPKTSAQQSVRAIFGAIASSWRLLTDPQRKGWEEASKEFPYKDVFGDTKQLSGAGLHQKLNGNLASANLSLLNDAPAVEGVSSIIGEAQNSYSVQDDKWLFKLDLNAIMPVAGAYVIEATAKVSNGISNFSGRYRSIYTGALSASADEIVPVSGDLTEAYSNMFGKPVLGANIGVRVRVVNKNGETSPWYYTKMVIVPGQ